MAHTIEDLETLAITKITSLKATYGSSASLTQEQMDIAARGIDSDVTELWNSNMPPRPAH